LCKERHPKVCKWFVKEVGCKRENCDFLHVTLATNDDNEKAHKKSDLKCAGCKSTFESESYVVNHTIKERTLVFCLNCDDWIQNKEEVLKTDWSLFDANGDLRRDV
jgi:hypothetical protein